MTTLLSVYTAQAKLGCELMMYMREVCENSQSYRISIELFEVKSACGLPFGLAAACLDEKAVVLM